MGGRYFRPEEANRLLPTVTAAMTRLQAIDAEARRRQQEAAALAAIGRAPDGRPIMAADVRQAREAYEMLVRQGRTILESIRGLGLEVRSIEYGLVDFPATLGGEEVWLCWRLGEARVAFYHGQGEGFAKRRPLSAEAWRGGRGTDAADAG
jgi:hypothetical protein